MRIELEQTIAGKYPFMRVNRGANNNGVVYDLYAAFGMEFDDGWYGIVDKMCANIQSVFDAYGVDVDFVPTQMKEKYGTLCVYYAIGSHPFTHLIDKIVDLAQDESGETCEICGAPGDTGDVHGWIRTLCDKCREEKDGR